MGLDDVGKRPKGHTVPVGQRAALAPVDELLSSLDVPEELPDESRLADPRRADEGYKLCRAVRANVVERPDERCQLAGASHELRLLPEAICASAATRCDELPDRHGLRLPLGREGRRGPKVDLEAGATIRPLVDQDPVHGRTLLEPRGCVDDVAMGHRLALGGACPDLDDDFTRRNPDANVKLP